MLTTLSSGQSSFSLLSTFVWGSVTEKPGVLSSGPRGSSRPEGGSWRAKPDPLSSPHSLPEHKQIAQALWLTASFHALPTTYRAAALSPHLDQIPI